jgi:hypothetical protein
MKHQFLDAREDCKKGVTCPRQHYNPEKKNNVGYFWNYETMSVAVLRAGEKVLSSLEKTRMIAALKVEFNV